MFPKELLALLLCLATGHVFSQHHKKISSDSVIVTGKIINVSGVVPDNQVFLVDKNNPITTMVKSNGYFSLKIMPTDTLLFRSAGFVEKKICIKDSVRQGQSKFNLVVKLDSLKGYFVMNEADSEAMLQRKELADNIDKLYAVFSRMDTLHKFTVGVTTTGQKTEALRNCIDYYVLHPFINRVGFIPFRKMSSTSFYDFLGFLHFSYDMGARNVWNNDNPKLLIADTRSMYKFWKASVRERQKAEEESENEKMAQASESSNSSSDNVKARGIGGMLLFSYYLIRGIIDAQ